MAAILARKLGMTQLFMEDGSVERVTVLEAGCRKIRIVPNLGDLEWAEGSVPTPRGPVVIRIEKTPEGKVETEIRAPSGIRIVRQ